MESIHQLKQDKTSRSQYSKGTIYYLYDPRRKEEIRYIGKTVCLLKNRLKGHIRQAKLPSRKTKCHKWIYHLLKQGIEPKIKALERVNGTPGDLDKAESKWIGKTRKQNHRLCNHTNGGEGGATRNGYKNSEEQKAKVSEAVKRQWSEGLRKPFIHTEESKAKIGAAHKGRIFSEESKAKMSRSHKGKKMPDHVKEILLNCHLGKPLSEKHKQTLSKTHQGHYVSPETKKKISESHKGKKGFTRSKEKDVRITEETMQY